MMGVHHEGNRLHYLLIRSIIYALTSAFNTALVQRVLKGENTR
jgi:hypothetical protein